VARRSLTEVRQAVTSYRQPSLAAELVSSRRMLASAGIDCQLRAPGAYSLPPAVDALLAWTVREGATNIVRHSAARHAEIVIALTDTEATARLSDDGAGPRGKGLRAIAGATASGSEADGGGGAGGDGAPRGGAAAGAGGGPAGSGLAGLAERAARLGGALSAGAGEDGGFWLRVSVPLTGTSTGGAAADPGAGRERMPS
jgi:two-component system sensor histidine kinase DesK